MDIIRLQDAVLRACIDQAEYGKPCEFDHLKVEGPPPFDSVESMLLYFEEIRLIENFIYGEGILRFNIRPEAYDLNRHGGFYGKEIFLKQNLEKLLLEIKNLSPSGTKKANEVTTIINNIANFLGVAISAYV